MYIPIWLIFVIVAVGVFWFINKRKAVASEHLPFRPYFIRIVPNWYLLLKDYGVIKDDQQWGEIEEVCDKDSKYNVVRDGILFTILKSAHDGKLIFCNSSRSFQTEVKFDESLSLLKVGEDYPLSQVGLYVRDSGDYEFGITTPDSFKKVCMVGDDNDHIKVATLPKSLFGPVYPYGDKRNNALSREHRKRLKEAGWEQRELDSEQKMAGYPEQLNHKYFTVYYNYI